MYPFSFLKGGASIDAQAQAHFDRVIADGGLVPSGLSGVNAFFTTIKAIYGTSDITTAISVGLDAQVLGYKLGAGAGDTLGQAAQKLYSCSGASGDVVQTTAASQPLLLVHSGENYWQGVNVGSNLVTTPNAVANQFAAEIEIIAKISVGLSGSSTILSKAALSGATGMGYQLTVNSVGNLLFAFNPLGDVGTRTTVTSTATLVSVGYTANQIIWIKCTRVASTGVIEFFYSFDGNTYIQLGASITSLTGNLFNTNEPLDVGSWRVVNPLFGKIFNVTASPTIGGTPTVNFNPNQYNAATSQTQFTSSTGEVWSVQTGTATTGYKGQIVTKTTIQGDGVDDRLTSGTLPTRQYFTRFAAFNYLVGQAPEYIIAGNPVETHLIYFQAGTLRFYNTSQEINVSGAIANNLQLITGDYNGASSKVRRNNAADVTGTTGAATSTIVNLFSSGAGTLFSNAIINTEIDAVAVSNDTQKTAMYNYIKLINNNAF